MQIINIAAYKFVQLTPDLLIELKTKYKEKTRQNALKGTILLSAEGINLCLAGLQNNIEAFKACLAETPAFGDLIYKQSPSETQPFKRMLIKIKPEIITFGVDNVHPERFTAPYVSPQTLKQWYDEGKEMVILDTRNLYEIEKGSFNQAVHLNLATFREFPQAVSQLPESFKKKSIVTFCTGGIRCEKASAYLLQQGFQEVYQLHGGILNYFAECGNAHYQGECFVFDERITIDAE